MLRMKVALLVFGLMAFSMAMPFDVIPIRLADDIDDCQLCHRVVGAAERHHHNNLNNTSKDQLRKELDRDCYQFTHTHGQGAAKKCADFVDAHIDTIYNDIVAGKRPEQVCEDLGLCGTSPSFEKAPEVLPEHDPCHTCSFIVGRAEHRFRPNETADQLKGHLEAECQQLGQLQGQDAADNCKKIVDDNIQTIYDDIKSGKRPHQICVDIGECAGAGTGQPPSGPPPQEPQNLAERRPHDPCHTCEFIIGRAEHHLHNNNVTDENRLLRELEHECIQLAHTEGDQAAVACLNIVQKNIDKIFNDINAGERPRQVCEDLGECTPYTGPTRVPVTTVLPTLPSKVKSV